jgi:hypothetical protein
LFECRAGLLQKASPALFTQPVAIATDGDDLAVVEQPVEDHGGDDRIAEHGSPLADGAVRGDQHGTALVASRDQLEEQMRVTWSSHFVPTIIDAAEANAHFESFYAIGLNGLKRLLKKA